MRLLKFDDQGALSLTKDLNDHIPAYAILSHTWGDDRDEVGFDDLNRDSSQNSFQKKPGYAKIQFCGEQAAKDKLKHFWVDTCCIDKANNTEYSEAINSMYRWYRDAAKCYVYLSDVSVLDGDEGQAWKPDFQKSRWFTRGWTLQELLAPNELTFFDKRWTLLGSRDILCKTISRVTRIKVQVLLDARLLRTCSIAERMSWAADRNTRRREDIAYSLLGIFGINTPMIYGEGDRAFIRLQEEIIKSSDDHSLFAWRLSADPENCALLARSPKAFKTCNNIALAEFRTGHPYTVTNRGLSMTLILTPWSVATYAASLNCFDLSKNQPRVPEDMPARKYQIGIFLRRGVADDKYTRISFDGMDFVPSESMENIDGGKGNVSEYAVDHKVLWQSSQEISVHIQRTISDVSPTIDLVPMINGFRIGPEIRKLQNGKEWLWDSELVHEWDGGQHILTFPAGHGENSAVLNISTHEKMVGTIRLGFNFEFDPVCYLLRNRIDKDYGKILFDHGFRFLYPYYFDNWNSVEKTSSMKLARPSNRVLEKGLWRLKGDRLEGLNIYLPDYGTSKRDPHAHVIIQRVKLANATVWEFDIKNLGHISKWRNVRQ